MQPTKAITIVIVALILTGMCGYFLQPTHEEVSKTTYDYKGDLTPSVIYSQIDDWTEYNPLTNVTGWTQREGTTIPVSESATPYLNTPKIIIYNSVGTTPQVTGQNPPGVYLTEIQLGDLLNTNGSVVKITGALYSYYFTYRSGSSYVPMGDALIWDLNSQSFSRAIIDTETGLWVVDQSRSDTQGIPKESIFATSVVPGYMYVTLEKFKPIITEPTYIDATRFVTIDEGYTGIWSNGQVNGTVRVLCTPNMEFVIGEGISIYCPSGLPYSYLLCTLDFHNNQFYCQGVESFNNTLSYTVADYKYDLKVYVQPDYAAPNALIFTEDYRMFVGTLSGGKAIGYTFKGYELNSGDLNLPIDSNPSTQYRLNVYNLSDRTFRLNNNPVSAYSSVNLITYNAQSIAKNVEWTDSDDVSHTVGLGVEVTEEIPAYSMPESVTGLSVKQAESKQYGVYQQYNIGTRDAYSHLNRFDLADTSFIYRGDSEGSNQYELKSGDIIYAVQGMTWTFYVGTTESIKINGVTYESPSVLHIPANSNLTLNIERTVNGETIETAIMIRLISSTEWNNCPEKGYALSTFKSRIPIVPIGSDVKVFVDSTVVAVDPNGILWGDPKMPLAYFYPEQMQYDTRVLFNGFVKYGNFITINGTTFPVSDGYLLYTHTVIVEGEEVEVTEHLPLKGMAIDYVKRTGESQFDVTLVFTEKGDYTIEMGALDTTEVTFTYDIQVYDPDTGTTQTVTKTVNTYAGFLVSATGNWYWQSGIYTITTTVSDNIGLDLESANFGLTMTASSLLMLFFMILGTAAMRRFTDAEFCTMDWVVLICVSVLLLGVAIM